ARFIFRGDARALATAIEDGNLARVKGLVAQGVDVNAAGRKGETLLWFALRWKRRDEAIELVVHGADPLRAPEGEAKAMTKAAQDPAPADVLQAMLDAGMSPEATDDVVGSAVPLIFLAMNTNALPNIRVVVDAGARLSVRDTNGHTPLTRAINWR